MFLLSFPPLIITFPAFSPYVLRFLLHISCVFTVSYTILIASLFSSFPAFDAICVNYNNSQMLNLIPLIPTEIRRPRQINKIKVDVGAYSCHCLNLDRPTPPRCCLPNCSKSRSTLFSNPSSEAYGTALGYMVTRFARAAKLLQSSNILTRGPGRGSSRFRSRDAPRVPSESRPSPGFRLRESPRVPSEPRPNPVLSCASPRAPFGLYKNTTKRGGAMMLHTKQSSCKR